MGRFTLVLLFCFFLWRKHAVHNRCKFLSATFGLLAAQSGLTLLRSVLVYAESLHELLGLHRLLVRWSALAVQNGATDAVGAVLDEVASGFGAIGHNGRSLLTRLISVVIECLLGLVLQFLLVFLHEESEVVLQVAPACRLIAQDVLDARSKLSFVFVLALAHLCNSLRFSLLVHSRFDHLLLLFPALVRLRLTN